MEKPAEMPINSIKESLNYLDVVPMAVGNRKFYISLESTESASILKSPGCHIRRLEKVHIHRSGTLPQDTGKQKFSGIR